jgi:hypothetical protein
MEDAMRNFVAIAAAAAAATSAVVVASAPAGAAAVPSCRGALIAVSHTPAQGAMGHGNLVLRFKNISQHTCSLRGYPGVDALGPHGGVLAHARRTVNGYTGGASAVRTIVLHSWQTASADLEWLNFKPRTGGDCRFSHSIAVTPPNTSRTSYRQVSVSACNLQIHPVVKGLTGNS